MRYWYIPPFFLFLVCYSGFSFGQCMNSGGRVMASLNTVQGAADTIECNLASEYGIWQGIVSAYSYTTSSASKSDYLTVRSGTPEGEVIAFGKQPLTWTAKHTGVHFIHVNTNATCGVEALCRMVITNNNGPANACKNPINPGKVSASVKSACLGNPFQLALSEATVATGLSYQWQSSLNGTDFTSIPGETNLTCTVSQTSSTYYRCVLSCSGGANATATTLRVDMGTCAKMSTGTLTSCDGNFYDSGEASSAYQNDENDTLTIKPTTSGNFVQIAFDSFDLQPGDELLVYNGNSVLSPLLGTFSSHPVALTSGAADGSLTFVFKSNTNGTSAGWAGMIGCVTVPANDNVCTPLVLTVDGLVKHFNNGASTLEVKETDIVPPATGFNRSDGWGVSALEHTVWFTFNAPPSGNVMVSCTDVASDGQVAVYKVGSCADFSTYALVGANDNAVDFTSASPKFSICGLSPGQKYYLMYDSGNSYTSGPFSIALSEISLNAGNPKPLVKVCSGDTVDLFDGIQNFDIGGIWKEVLPTFGVYGSLWHTSGVAYDKYEFLYLLKNGCLADTSRARVEVYGPSQAGNDGTLSACKKEYINLLGGLSGNVDLGGIWYDPSNTPIGGNLYTMGENPGQFNFDYIADNGVCPKDTANVLVIVSNCVAGVDDMDNPSLVVYPNPSTGVFYLRGFQSEVPEIKVLDGSGKQVPFLLDVTNDPLRMELQGVSPGLYFLQISREGTSFMHKMSIQ